MQVPCQVPVDDREWGSIRPETQNVLILVFFILQLRAHMAAKPILGAAILLLMGVLAASVLIVKQAILIFGVAFLLGIAITTYILVSLFFNNHNHK